MKEFSELSNLLTNFCIQQKSYEPTRSQLMPIVPVI